MTHAQGRKLNALFALLVINLVLYVLDHLLPLINVRTLYLHHYNPQWYQFITSMFCHANWAHISGNLFFLYIFGKMIEEDQGPFMLIGCYLLCGLGANLLSYLFLPSQTVSLGASGAVFGLFTVVVMLKLSLDWRKLIELVILGQFVLLKILSETQSIGADDGINRVAHLGGALCGAIAIFVLNRLRQKVRTATA